MNSFKKRKYKTAAELSKLSTDELLKRVKEQASKNVAFRLKFNKPL